MIKRQTAKKYKKQRNNKRKWINGRERTQDDEETNCKKYKNTKTDPDKDTDYNEI